MISNRIDRAEVQKQRGKHDEARVAQKGDRQIQIFVGSDRRIEVKDEGGQAERSEVQHKRRTSALFEYYEQPDAEIDQADHVDVEVASGPIRDRSQVIEVGIIVPRFRWIRRALNKVMNLSDDPGVVEIDLDILGVSDLFAFRAPRDV